MSIVDKVAQFIYEGHKQTAATMPGTTIQDLYRYTKRTTDQPHPRKSLTLQYIIRVGDILQPVDVTMLPVMGDLLILAPSQRFVVFNISCATPQFDLSAKPTKAGSDSDVKCIILQYNHVKGEIDLDDIGAVVCCSSHLTVVNLLDSCNLIGNISHLM